MKEKRPKLRLRKPFLIALPLLLIVSIVSLTFIVVNNHSYSAAVEKTVQRYNTNVLDMYKTNSDTYYRWLLVSLIVITVLFILLIILTFKKTKKHTKNKREKFDE